MATTGDDRDRDHSGPPSGAPTESGRKWGKILIPLAILVAILAVFAFMLLVSQRGAEDDSEIYNGGTGSAAVVVEEPEDAAVPR